MEDIYLKIYVENGDTLVFEGNGTEDKEGYYPIKWDPLPEGDHRIGTVVVGASHIAITEEAKEAFKKIVKKANHTRDDISCIDIHKSYKTINGKFEEYPTDVCVSYMGALTSKFNIEEVIHDEKFFIGCGEGIPNLRLLDKLSNLDQLEDDLEQI